jgi:MinD-like ATPase involved in chromosome partitioning or flagellar assembly
LDIRFIGALPIEIELHKSSDEGVPFLIESGNSETGIIFDKIAQDVAADVATS